MAPAVERVQKAHCLFFILCRTTLHDRADQHFDETTADGIDDDCRQKTDIRISNDFRQENKSQKSGRRADMRCHDTDPVADLIHEFRGQQIDKKLNSEVNGNQHRNLAERDMVCFLERQKQQRYKVVDDRLNDVADKAGVDRFFIITVHVAIPLSFIFSTIPYNFRHV